MVTKLNPMCMRIDAQMSPRRTATTPETAPNMNRAGTTARSPIVGLEHRVRERERERLHDRPP